MFKIVSLANWNDGLWHVRSEWPVAGQWIPVFEPRNGDDLFDVVDCILWVKERNNE